MCPPQSAVGRGSEPGPLELPTCCSAVPEVEWGAGVATFLGAAWRRQRASPPHVVGPLTPTSSPLMVWLE